MASSKVILLAVVTSVHATDAPAPSPASPATAISPSFIVGCVTAATALVFHSSLRI
ncbi:transmembrane protein, putative [Medicago truncatula]|uniref:Transmembrane protein, putative n=1 Tax=Medicago truncatula TaxID=3880 RepID=G7J7K0_MEDTR|nr:transmembrane protein, putative [Medicago truncatula]